MSRECLLIADDLTGACDAAVHFARRGYTANASVDASDPGNYAPVVALNTDSRDFGEDEIRRMMAGIARVWQSVPARILYKKIDSTLRGNGGIEIREAVRAFDCDKTVITPALPVLGRIVEGGWLRLTHDDTFAPIDVLAWLGSQGVSDCVRTTAAGAALSIASGAHTLLVDAVTDADLDELVANILRTGQRILWVGSAGLAAALARALPWLETTVPSIPQHRGPVLFCAGSDHKVTLNQIDALVASRGAACIFAETATPSFVRGAIDRGQHVIVKIGRDSELARVEELVAGSSASALLLTGGDTAALVCRAVGAARIELIDEIVAGLPRGVLCGGELEGLPVVTKSGGFGEPDALIRVADFFGSAAPPH